MGEGKNGANSTVTPGTYFKIIGQTLIIILIYVDDTLFMGNNKAQVLAHKKQFMK